MQPRSRRWPPVVLWCRRRRGRSQLRAPPTASAGGASASPPTLSLRRARGRPTSTPSAAATGVRRPRRPVN
eukprot:7294619-Alexandrium_andersonii.AAC.1